MTQILVRLPGKTILTGEHAAVYSKTVVAATVGLYLYTFAETTDTLLLNINFADLGHSFSFSFDELAFFYESGIESFEHPGEIENLFFKLQKEGKLSITPIENQQLHSAVMVALYLTTSIIPASFKYGITLNIKSSIPLGSGLGSSAAYSAALSSGLLYLSSKFNVNTPMSEIRKLVDHWAFKAEQVVHGTPSGVDNSTVINGGFVKYAKGNPLIQFRSNHSLQFLIVDTLIPKNTKLMVANLNKDYKSGKPGVKESIDEINQISEEFYSTLKNISDNDNLEIAEENLSNLIEENQKKLKFLGVSHESLDKIVSTAKTHGYSAKLTGGGGGGCALVFIPHHKKSNLENVINEIKGLGYIVYKADMGVDGLSMSFSLDNRHSSESFASSSFVDLDEMIKT
ncbi:hypothetical protein BB560_005909 [Smittium megazygosporum]|uniref:Mevalonate kinase n=1 Tax=Smittium megazygosporum TaxID=133381 RepID=A0A2T9YRA4_9FUNG|nr:hypothetical protein BB560_005909 [Smittium megazygosporum]